jgi:hypothetical protein
MKKPFFKWMAMVMAVTIITTVSCNKDDNPVGNEEELITTLRLTMRETGSATTKVFEFKDTDGPGGNPPVKFDNIVLSASKNYSCAIEVLNESVSPAENITAEVIAEADDHQFYFEPAVAKIDVINLNTDSKGLPLGVTSTWNTGAVGNGTIKITLKHKPGIKAVGDPVTKGETDIEVNFTAQVQ